jgi:primosomal protein N' (replication factor Y)
VFWERVADADAAVLSKRAARMRAVLAHLENGPAAESQLRAATECTRDILRTLGERGLIRSFRLLKNESATSSTANASKPQLNEAQQAAVATITDSLGGFASHLLFGVTGSGKTEVYLHAIEAVLARGQQSLVLVPEIALTPQLISRFRNRLSTSIAVLHSGLTERERLIAWRQARNGSARIVIGTRSAVFSPFESLGLIIVDEEHDGSYKQQEGFRYSARDLAIMRAQRCKARVVLGSATPSLETLHRSERHTQSLLRLKERAASAQPPRIALIDLRTSPASAGISTPALLAMQRHLQAGGQVLLFLNRRGYAPVLFCPQCGWSAHCPRCDAHLTIHGASRRLICHHCATEQSPIEICPSCNAATKPVGQGTDRIEETIAQTVPGFPLARIDRDSMRRKGELEATLARAAQGELRILVGTQMLTKGHDFPNVTLVVVLNADQGLFSTDFRASERLAQTIIQVAGRAGRADKPGEVLIQTEYPDHALLKQLLEGGYEAFASAALIEREKSGWPPYSRIALLRAEATHPTAAMRFLKSAADAAEAHRVRNVELLGPAPSAMERRAGRFRAQLLVLAPSHGPMQKFLGHWLGDVETLPLAKQVRWSIDVDAMDLS